MSLDIAAVQAALREDGLDGWLLYDFRGVNPVAARLTGVADSGHMATRRWYDLIPRDGTPTRLVHAIERHNLDSVPGTTVVYAGRDALTDGLQSVLAGRRRLAMEYSKDCAIPDLSRVDAGTIELMRSHGVEVVSSGDLSSGSRRSGTTPRWPRIGMPRSGCTGSRIERWPSSGRDRRRPGHSPSTTSSRRWSRPSATRACGQRTAPPVVGAAGQRRATRTDLPTAKAHRAVGRATRCCSSNCGASGRRRARLRRHHLDGLHRRHGFRTASRRRGNGCRRGARRRHRLRQGRHRRRPHRPAASRSTATARKVLDRTPGYAAHILHRTGRQPRPRRLHGNGVHMDDYETHDDRRLVPGLGFTIEPGLYFDDFGIRTEINMTVGQRQATVTGDRSARDGGPGPDGRAARTEFMSTRKDDFLHARPLIAVVSLADRHGHRLAPRHGAPLEAQALSAPPPTGTARRCRARLTPARSAASPTSRVRWWSSISTHLDAPRPTRPTTRATELFRRFFGTPRSSSPTEPQERSTGAGTGFIIDNSAGLILTNNHVVEARPPRSASSSMARKATRREGHEARVVGRDPLTDSALIELVDKGAAGKMPQARFGDSDRDAARATGSSPSATRSATTTPSRSA